MLFKIMFLIGIINYITWLLSGRKQSSSAYCGLVGYFSHTLNYDPVKFKLLMAYNELRGAHSSGIYIKDIGMVKAEGPTTTNLLNKVKFPTEGKVIIAHTRYATTGAKTKENAHPFVYGNLVLAHNGKISNAWQVANNLKGYGNPVYKYDVDSQVIPQHINTKLADAEEDESEIDSIIAALEELEGPQALLFTDISYPDRLYFYRRSQKIASDERPLYKGIIRVGDEEGYYFSSMKEALEAIECIGITEVKEDNLYWYSKDSNKLNYKKLTNLTKPKVVPYTPYVKPVEKPMGILKEHYNIPQASIVDFDRGTVAKDDIFDYEEALQDVMNDYDEEFNGKKKPETVKPNPHSSTKLFENEQFCTECTGTGIARSSYLQMKDCPQCEGRGKLPIRCLTLMKMEEEYNHKDVVYITYPHQFHGHWGFIDNITVNNKVRSYTVYTDEGMRVAGLRNEHLDIIKTNDNIFCQTLKQAVEKWGCPKNVHSTLKTIEEQSNIMKQEASKKKEEPVLQYGEELLFENAKVGDIIVSEKENACKIYEIVSKKPDTSQYCVRVISPEPGKKIIVHADDCRLLERNSDKFIWTLEDLAWTLKEYYPKTRLVNDVADLLVDIDDSLEQIISNVLLSDNVETTVKLIYQLKEQLRIKTVTETGIYKKELEELKKMFEDKN